MAIVVYGFKLQKINTDHTRIFDSFIIWNDGMTAYYLGKLVPFFAVSYFVQWN